jgi:hypothetical protein
LESPFSAIYNDYGAHNNPILRQNPRDQRWNWSWYPPDKRSVLPKPAFGFGQTKFTPCTTQNTPYQPSFTDVAKKAGRNAARDPA